MAYPGPELSLKVSTPGLSENRMQGLHFRALPNYAQYLLQNRVRDLAIQQLSLVKDLRLPAYHFVEWLPEEELIEIGVQSIVHLLELLSKNKSSEFIDQSQKIWLSNRGPLITRDQISPEDIAQFSFIRRKLFRDMLPDYTSDPKVFTEVMEELDCLLVELDSVTLKNLFMLHQDLYKQAQLIAHLGNWSMDIKSKRLSWSDELYRIYGLDPGDELPHDLKLYNHPEDRQMVQDEVARALEEQKPFDFYYRIILDNGKQKNLHAKGTLLFDEAGKALSLVGTVQDVTQEKIISLELSSSQTFIRKVADMTPSIITVYNIHTGRYIFINQALKTILGYEPETAKEKGVDFLLSIIHPDDMTGLMEKNNKALEFANSAQDLKAEEIIIDFKYRIRHKKGHYRWFQTYGTVFRRNHENKVEDVLNISVDITEQELFAAQLEQQNLELSKNEERYHKMTEMVEDYAILLLSSEGIIENWSRGAEKIKGYKAEEVIGKHFRIFYTPSDQKEGLPEKLMEIALREGKATHEGWRARKNGSVFWGYIVITALRDENNEVFGFSKVTRDLTEKRQTELKLEKFAESLQEKNFALEQMNKELESFTYVASHDLQEPLRKIKTFTNFIISSEKEQFSDTTKDYFARIVSAADRMQHLIESLLQLSRISSTEPVFESTDLNLLLDEAKKDHQDTLAEKQAIIEADKLPFLNVNPLQIQQVFSNILGNSLKYASKDRPLLIRISAEKMPAKQILANIEKQYCWRICFTDNGIGFEQQYANRIFEPFQRLHGKLDYPGTGIGLAICKKIIQFHGGTMNASGESGKGASFDFYLPE